MEKKENKIPDYLLQLIEGCSTYVKVSIQFWMAIAFFSIVAISPAKAEDGKIKMPFDVGTYSERDFYPFVFVIIALLVLGFGSAFYQAGRTRKLIQRAVDNNKDALIFDDNIYLQDVIDTMIHPALNRVAPLAQMLQGKNQFFPEAFSSSLTRRLIATTYYLILKMVASCVMYFTPGYALVVSFFGGKLNTACVWNVPSWIFWIIGITALTILLQLFITDLYFVKGAIKRINIRRR